MPARVEARIEDSVVRSKVIVLLTDFGAGSSYVGAMKGVILGITPDARIADLAHDIPPQDVESTAYVLGVNYRYFPVGTVFCAVVDPGVGSARKAVCLEAGDRMIVCPDNGLASYVLKEYPLGLAVEITKPGFRLPEVSATFHGRDVFAPAAAHLARGVDLRDLGPRLATVVKLKVRKAKMQGSSLIGEIVYVDAFGNLVTNVTEEMCRRICAGSGLSLASVRLGKTEIEKISATYADVAPGAPVALFGSSGRLEISVNGGSAACAFGAARGTTVAARYGASIKKKRPTART